MEEKEGIQIQEQRHKKWKTAYENRWKRIETIYPVKNVIFDAPGKTYASKQYEVLAYRKMCLLIDSLVTGSPTNIQIYVQFSHNGQKWFNYTNGPFGSLIYSAAAGNVSEYIVGDVVAHWMRIYIVSSGCSAGNTFRISCAAELSG